MSHWVYIIYSESADVFYKGQTDDLSGRIIRHNNRWEKATRHGAPWKLVWRMEKPDRSSAMDLEKKLKHLTRKRLTEFISKYPEGFAGPDALTFIVRGQGADRIEDPDRSVRKRQHSSPVSRSNKNAPTKVAGHFF